MEQSIFFEYVKKYFPQLVLTVTSRLNDTNNRLTYMYRDLLTKRFSADGRWASILAEYTRVAADVVALDSELPLKARDSVSSVTGDIPKIGMKLALTEKQLKDIDSMLAQPNLPIRTVVQAIFADLPRCIEGVYERIEDMFLSEMSTGVGLTERNNGTGVRIDVGYKKENAFYATTTWSDAGSTPISDIQKIFDKALADGHTITDVYTDDTTLRNLYKNTEVKQQFAFIQNFVGSAIPNLNYSQLQQVFQSVFGITLHRVARKVRTELNGIQVSHSPWASGRMVFTCDDRIGSLVWTTLAEASRPVAGVVYQTTDDYILASRYSKNDPFREITSSQAMVVPIIDNVDRIYTMDPTRTQSDMELSLSSFSPVTRTASSTRKKTAAVSDE